MTIGVDAGALCVTDERLKVGVYRVTYNLLKQLGTIDTKNTYRLYSFAPIDRGVMKEFGAQMENKVITPSTGWATFWLPLELKRRPVDVFLGLAQLLPSFSSSYNIGFIYDLAFLHAPKAYGKSYFPLKKQTKDVIDRANHIVTISHASKNDILDTYHMGVDKISVCYPGVDERFTSVGKKYKSEHPYFLFVGSLNRVKNLSLAIEAFALFLKKIGKPYDFLLIGGDYWPDAAIDEGIHKYGLEERIKKIGFVSDDELVQYYRGASLFLTTSIREGFCLPAVESMACGTPVVSVDRGAMKEVVGSGGIVSRSVEPVDVAGALYKATTDTSLYSLLKKEAITQAKRFSWKQFAQEIYSLLPNDENTSI